MPNSSFRRNLFVALFAGVVLVVLSLAFARLYPVWQRYSMKRALAAEGSTPTSRLRAAEGLARMGRTALPELLELLGSQDATVRVHAALAIGRLGPAGREACPHLEKALDDANGQVRQEALYALTKVADVETAWRVLDRALADEDLALRELAIERLAAMGPGAVPSLLGALENDHKPVSKQALHALAEYAPDNAAVRSALFEYLVAHRSAGVASNTLVGSGPAVVPLLVEQLESPDAPRRFISASLLAQIAAGPTKFASLPPEDEFQRRTAAQSALADATAAHQRIVGILIEALEDSTTRVGATQSLRFCIREHAMDALHAALGSTRAPVRHAAAIALGAEPQEAEAILPALVEALDDEDPTIRMGAADELYTLGPAARQALPALTRLLDDPVKYVADSAAQALEKIRSDGAQPH